MGDMEPKSRPRLGLDEVRLAAERVSAHLHKTPVLTSTHLNALAGRQLFFKAEHLQKTGSFKARGACNAVFMEKQMNPESMGVVTDSSGNHAQAVAYAARCVGLPCTVVVPKGAPKVKCDAIQEYGASLVFCDPSPTARKETCARVAQETGKTIIHSSSNYHVIAGQGTLALELLEEIPDLDAILVPVSGGGMLAGVSVVAHLLQPKCQVYAVEPVGKDLQRCLEAKERLWPSPPVFLNTVADSIRLQEVGELTFPIICEYANHKVFTVTDEKMVQGMKLIFERMKQVVEAASGAGVYAAVHLLKDIQPKAKKVGVILCGGNVDLDVLPWLTRTTSYQ
ncbi:probable serine racemase isoform X3 [Portunus trituberculatus]|nr:probable serine racemase isoform X3 [Portunus trituberculatus]XP_045119763.1 probable serine racemase isoform X3 [Portunus trituberculatus]XP_045119764.1 probable serine racemase isoform X3 [Portunus trituberculatus]XP_045119765.1 probable serine racemase isoform X3 [Portunus trituberculatus]